MTAPTPCPGCVYRDRQIDLLSASLRLQAESAQVLSARLHAAEQELGRRVAAEAKKS